MANLITWNGHTPRVHRSAFIAPTAVLIGDVEVGPESSIWFGAVLRGDDPRNGIRVGARTSVQDNCVIHVSARGPTLIGDDVTVGHGVVFESCDIRRGSLIGMNAVILQGAIIDEESLVAALSVVPENMHVPARTLVAGAPARVRKNLEGESARWVRESAAHYVALSRQYMESGGAEERESGGDGASGLSGSSGRSADDGGQGGGVIEKGADVVVVGGGVIGCAVAGELARRGLAVTVIERGEPGRGASWAAGGMLSPYGEAPGGGPFLALSDESLRRYAAFADALLEETSIDVEYRASGKLHVSLGDDDAGLRAMADSADAAKFGVTLMDGAAARVLEPGLPEAVTTAVLVDRDYRVNNRRLADALPAAAIAAGAVLRTGDPVRAVWTERGAAAGVELLSGERIEAPHVVICAGAWSSELGGLPRPLPVRPMLGQMFAVNAAGRNPPERVLAARGCYIIPREDGRLVIGATVEDVGFRDGPTPRGISTLMAAAARLLPAVADLPLVESWSGFRPGTPDHLPIIGADPDVAGLFYATGHFRNGILLAPITAECIAELVTHGTPPLSLDAFKVEREWRVESGE